MSWHIDAAVIDRYQEGGLDRTAAASVEAHVTGCDRCRRLVSLDAGRLERSWMAVVERVEPSGPGLVERGLSALGVPAHIARIVAVSPALRVSFVLAVVLVTGFAAAASASN
ncbi:MAG: zf-HC2 domain-containing protein, partial [Dehalococcoidia bacterium]